MNKKRFNWWSDGASVTSEYQAVLDRATALGYAHPSAAQKTKQNALIAALKTAGIWTGLDVFYVYATDGDRNFAKLNWVSPSSYACTEVNTPTFTSNIGFNGNGTTSYLNSNWIPSTNGVNYTQNDASIGCYVNTEGAENQIVFGCYGPSGHTTYLIPRIISTGLSQVLINFITPAINPADSPLLAKKFWHLKRTASNSFRLYYDGTATANQTNASTARADAAVFIGARNANGTADFPTAKQIGCFFAGASLNGLESSFSSAWYSYFNSL